MRQEFKCKIFKRLWPVEALLNLRCHIGKWRESTVLCRCIHSNKYLINRPFIFTLLYKVYFSFRLDFKQHAKIDWRSDQMDIESSNKAITQNAKLFIS